MNFSEYVQDVSKRFATGNAREHAYRPSLQNLLEATIPDILATNDPARIKCGAPDFILTRRKIDVGYIEAKDIGVDLNKTEKDEQLKRYLDSLDNLILTDYLEFRFFLHGQKVETIRIGEVNGNAIRPLPENFDRLKTLLIDFAAFQGQTIKSAKKLAAMMAHKARLMRDVFRATLEAEEPSTLKDQMKAFKTILMHDLDAAQFADIYAQTIAYGLFTARLHDTTLEDFSRSEALLLIPASNPFLRQLFSYVAGPELDSRVVWIVDALCEVYRATDLRDILKDFGTSTGQNDPILHFYETFLGEYDRSLKKARGVWYTPEPVVQFIVRAIDDVLKDHFGLKDGLADTSKVEIEVDSDRVNKKTGKREKDKKSVHKVQLLDVATGTGTFLAEAVKQIYRRFEGQEGLWSRYVDHDLLPRLHGFELLMASYAMCHMKLDLLLRETGYRPEDAKKPPRVGVYLTNSLEEHHPDADTLFASWLSHEANAASRIKKDMPIMVAFGNPPYSGVSSNMSSWIAKTKIEDYKYVDGAHFNERKHWLNDDYVQFIRLGEHYIEKNGEGILAYITNHGYLDNPTFRGMRWHLLNTFDDIYVLDLHGNANKKEVTPDGKLDKNVFDIQQGVSIIVAAKRPQKDKEKPLAKIYHAELWGSRESKYDFLKKNSLSDINWQDVKKDEKNFRFAPDRSTESGFYNSGFGVVELFKVWTTGVQTSRDQFLTGYNKSEIENNISLFADLSIADNDVRSKMFSVTSPKYPAGDTRDWRLSEVRKSCDKDDLINKITNYNFRPLDKRYICYSEKLCAWPRMEVGQHMLKENISLITARSNKSGAIDHFYVGNAPSDVKCGERTTGSIFCPLYIYEAIGNIEEKRPNFDPKIYGQIKKIIPNVTPESLFDYIYAVLHSPAYRQRYAEFLKSDFPRIPYPSDPNTFHALSEKGAALRGLHLMESPVLDKPITTYPVDGDHAVIKPRYEDGKVWINVTQYFGNVPEVAWNFYIGGYQPAQKWLKDRKGRTLTIDDIRHYQRIIIALTETDRIMREIDKIDFLPQEKG